MKTNTSNIQIRFEIKVTARIPMPNIFELQLRGMGAGKYSKSHNLLGMRVQRAELSSLNMKLYAHTTLKSTQEKCSLQ